MQSLDVYKKESGKIWQRKPSPSSEDGLVVSLTVAKRSKDRRLLTS